MKISIEQAVAYILAIPAHRSSNESHRKLGAAFYDQICTIAYSDQDPAISVYNAEALGIINSAVRMFSVVHDKMQQQWNELASIKQEREQIIKRIRLLSPLEKGNYFVKSIAIIAPLLFSIDFTPLSLNTKIFIPLVIIISIGLDALSNLVAFFVMKTFKYNYIQEHSVKWEKNAQAEYKEIITHVITDLCLLQNRVFLSEQLTEKDISEIAEEVIERKFYL